MIPVSSHDKKIIVRESRDELYVKQHIVQLMPG